MSIRAKLCHYVFASLFLKQPDSPTRSIMLETYGLFRASRIVGVGDAVTVAVTN